MNATTGMTERLKQMFSSPIICAVSGGRDYSDAKRVDDVLNLIDKSIGIELLIQGECPVRGGGADELSRLWAKRNEVNYMGVPAKSRKYGWPVCGPKRNAEIGYLLTNKQEHREHSLWVLFPGGKGTNSAREVAKAEGIARYEVAYGGEDQLIEGFLVTSGEVA